MNQRPLSNSRQNDNHYATRSLRGFQLKLVLYTNFSLILYLRKVSRTFRTLYHHNIFRGCGLVGIMASRKRDVKNILKDILIYSKDIKTLEEILLNKIDDEKFKQFVKINKDIKANFKPKEKKTKNNNAKIDSALCELKYMNYKCFFENDLQNIYKIYEKL